MLLSPHPFTEISGAEFNVFYKGTKFYKFLNNNLLHKTVRYQLGLNVDHVKFDPSGTCSEGGLYFCKES